MTILVTGGAGFIGSHAIDRLIEKGENIVCVDNFNDFYNPQIKEKNIRHNLSKNNFKLYKVDIENFEELKRVFEENSLTKIIHLAARAGVRPSIKNPAQYLKTNIAGTFNLLELSKIFGIKKFVFASSSSVYGNRQDDFFNETDNTDKPISPYAVTKKSGELICYTYNSIYKIPVACLRFFTVYGPRGRVDMAPMKFTKLIDSNEEIEIYGDINMERDYTYVSDIVEGILVALEKEFSYEIFNLGNSNPIKLITLITLIEKELGKKAKLKYISPQEGDVQKTFANINKAKEILNYKPNISIEQGIKEMVAWYNINKKEAAIRDDRKKFVNFRYDLS